MSHLIARSVVMLTMILLLPALLIRAQPYDDAGLRSFLFPAGCAAPCFVGVQPGRTSVEDAVALLDHHAWIETLMADIPLVIRGYGPVAMLPPSWVWSGAQPAWVDTSASGQTWVMNDRIDYVEIKTRLRLGEVWLILGRPDREQISTWEDQQEAVFLYSAWYDAPQLEVLIEGACPMQSLLNRPVTLRLRATAPEDGFFQQYAACD